MELCTPLGRVVHLEYNSYQGLWLLWGKKSTDAGGFACWVHPSMTGFLWSVSEAYIAMEESLKRSICTTDQNHRGYRLVVAARRLV